VRERVDVPGAAGGGRAGRGFADGDCLSALVGVGVGDDAGGVGGGAGAVVGARVGEVGVDLLAGGRALVLDQNERGELDGGGGVVRAERVVWEVVAQGVVGVAGRFADADLHEAGGAGGVGDAGAGGAWLQRA
jgi:hypothetical protein